MITMFTNVKVTRRKDFIIIQDGDETTLWTGQTVFSAFQWLHDNGIYTFTLDGGEKTMRIMIAQRNG